MLIVFVLLFYPGIVQILQCQWVSYFNYFETYSNDSSLVIGNEPGNIWQIGRPGKNFFNEAYSPPLAIVTDTVNYYPVNNYSSFEVAYNAPILSWAEMFYIGFWHKFDTDRNKDGGYLEVSWDDGLNWTNIVNDTLINNWAEDIRPGDFYSINDTITGGIPAFSGQALNWTRSDYAFSWLLMRLEVEVKLRIRFVFQSDDIQTNKEGWIIDNINIDVGYSGIDEVFYKKFNSAVYPNPIHSIGTIYFNNPKNSCTKLYIYNSQGSLIEYRETTNERFDITVEDYPAGIYFYRLTRESEAKYSDGKFVITK